MGDLMTILTNPLVEAIALGISGYMAKTKWSTIKAFGGRYIHSSLDKPVRVGGSESYSQRVLREAREAQAAQTAHAGRAALQKPASSSMQPASAAHVAMQPPMQRAERAMQPVQSVQDWLADAEPTVQN